MKVIHNPAEMQAVSNSLRSSGKTIGFVPTMGALHEGHLSLVRKALKQNDLVVVSIFVNPTQFGPNEDFTKYPRPFEADCALLEKEGAAFVFNPSPEEMYTQYYQTFIDLKRLPNHLCGLKREGHFSGVATVVTKLFNIVKPTISYFGQKDYQQSVIIRQMVTDLNMETQIHVMPIVREKDGLAMSSRNKYLSDKERKDALALSQALQLAEKQVREGERQSGRLIDEMSALIMKIAPSAKIDYVSIADPKTLDDIDRVLPETLVALAVYIGRTRLIDNSLIRI